MSKFDEGSILLDSLIALLILSVTLVTIYGLIIKGLGFSNKLTTDAEEVLLRSEEYDNSLQEIIKR